jgi:hypothetical protein
MLQSKWTPASVYAASTAAQDSKNKRSTHDRQSAYWIDTGKFAWLGIGVQSTGCVAG